MKTILKTCSKCQKEKSLELFRKRKKSSDGLGDWCNICNSESARNYYWNNLEKVKKYCRTEETKKRHRVIAKKMYALYPERFKARGIVYRAIKEGTIKRLPCEVCGKKKTEAHHKDYAKPLAVRWLCRPHHNSLHIKKLLNF